MRTKKTKIIIALIILLSLLTLPAVKSFSQKTVTAPDWSNLSFAAHEGTLNFFDHRTGKIYVFAEGSGQLRYIWKLQGLGRDLVLIR